MKKDFSLYKTLFVSTLMISAYTFGGGYVIVPLMEKRFVNELKWFDQDEMIDMIAIGQSTPGSIAVNVSILVGYRLAGFSGALITVIGTVFPPMVIISILSYVYMSIKDNVVINNVLTGMQAGVAAIIVSIVFRMAVRIIKQRRIIPIIMLIFSVVSGVYFNLNILLILLVSGIVGFVHTLYELKGKVYEEEAK